jgi:ABC-2 type transport system permease protein
MSAKSLAYIFKKEFKSFFLSPIAYIVIAIFLVVTGWFFFSGFFLNGRADLRNFFSMLPIVLCFVIPAITMRLYAEELRSGSYELLTTLPVSISEVLIGKYLAALAFIIVMMVPTVSYAVFIAFLGDVDWGPVIGGYVGAVLLAASYSALGVFASSLTKNQIIAFIIGLSLCFFLFIIDKVLFFAPGFMVGVLQFLGSDYHFRNIERGILDTRDIIYFLSVSFIALYVTHRVTQEKI